MNIIASGTIWRTNTPKSVCRRVSSRSRFSNRSRRSRMVSSIRVARSFFGLLLSGLFLLAPVDVALAQSDWRKDWERVLQEAKKEGKIVAGIPARAELRKELEAVFK